ncbi:VOC family protein [Jatrophihabitans sp.]|uniref:2-oxoadipate dioxygenase/decarboxylase n=1 Tax=Jatrophihabitans sp. TaxID=1932789 RepID=UPI0030C6C956|nr:hypothetical protein [Jatrophihabitans sp.]
MTTVQSRIGSTQLRAGFARRMSVAYGREVPAYTTLVEVAASVNADVLARDGSRAERLGTLERVSAERHGAIRVGTPAELWQASRIFAAMGMHPVGFYDLRDAARAAVPVISTAFRPVAAAELAANPFRMFTSLLVTDDRRFFSAELQSRLDAFLARRTLFPPELLALAERAVADDGLHPDSAERFLQLATAAFALSEEPVDAAWYAELEAVSAVAADIGGVGSTHINHLTPRVLDIDELYRRMTARGITMIDAIQGPPRWPGPDVLLRQTSFRALAEARRFRTASGAIEAGSLRVRFGEVEARGIALTPAGRDRYDALLAAVDRAAAAEPTRRREDVAREVWHRGLPETELGLLADGLAFFTFARGAVPGWSGDVGPGALATAVGRGQLVATPIVYEDFLPRSAAGIFASNLVSEGARRDAEAGARRDLGWLSDILGVAVADPLALYAAQQAASLADLPTAAAS